MKTRKNYISIVICCHNQLTNLEYILKQFKKQTVKPYEIIVADDNSFEPIETISKKFNCKFINTASIKKKNFHIGNRSLARQLGTNIANGEIILYLDGDIIPSPYLLEFITFYYLNHNEYSVLKVPRNYIITPNKQFQNNNQIFKYTNRNLNYISFESFTSDCFCVKKDILEEIGGWDTNFIGWGEEDIEIAYRFHRSEIPIILKKHPQFYCIHIDHGANHFKNYLSLQRNAKYFVSKFPEIYYIRNHMWQSLGVYLSYYGSSSLNSTRSINRQSIVN